MDDVRPRGAINEPVNGLTHYIGNGELRSVPFPIILAAIFLIISGYVLVFISYGRAVYAVGGNREAARLAGINVSGGRIRRHRPAAGNQVDPTWHP